MSTVVNEVWTKSKLLIKAGIIAILILLLMIPTFYVQNLIEERERRQKEAIVEVSSKWAGRQTIAGPFVVLPYWQTDSDNGTKKVRSKHFAFFLPDVLTATAKVMPQQRKRGLYKVMLYTSSINVSGNFTEPALQKLNVLPEDVIWPEAFVKFNIADVKGLNEELTINWNGQPLQLSPQSQDDLSGSLGLTAPLNVNGLEALKNTSFSTRISLNGSEQILSTPVGKSTSINISSSWPHPSFTGNILPQTTAVRDSGFTATWKSLAHKRNFPQQWKDGAYSTAPYHHSSDAFAYSGGRDLVNTAGVNGTSNINASSFGADLFVPVNGYQKTMRSVKYAILCIILTFSAFFLIETANKRSVHPFHYGLIGLALVLFYTLLLSFSEYIGFDASYAIASVATIGLIAWFVKGLLGSMKLSGIMSAVLVLIYTCVFTILQLQDYSLLFGSIGLFITLGVIMYFSRKFQW